MKEMREKVVLAMFVVTAGLCAVGLISAVMQRDAPVEDPDITIGAVDPARLPEIMETIKRDGAWVWINDSADAPAEMQRNLGGFNQTYTAKHMSYRKLKEMKTFNFDDIGERGVYLRPCEPEDVTDWAELQKRMEDVAISTSTSLEFALLPMEDIMYDSTYKRFTHADLPTVFIDGYGPVQVEISFCQAPSGTWPIPNQLLVDAADRMVASIGSEEAIESALCECETP